MPPPAPNWTGRSFSVPRLLQTCPPSRKAARPKWGMIARSCWRSTTEKLKRGGPPTDTYPANSAEFYKSSSAHLYIPVKLTLIIKGGQCWAKLLAPPSPDRVGTAVKITKGCRKSLLLGVKYGTAIHPHRQQGAG